MGQAHRGWENKRLVLVNTSVDTGVKKTPWGHLSTTRGHPGVAYEVRKVVAVVARIQALLGLAQGPVIKSG